MLKIYHHDSNPLSQSYSFFNFPLAFVSVNVTIKKNTSLGNELLYHKYKSVGQVMLSID